MQKVKISQRIPTKVWILITVGVLIAFFAALLILIPGFRDAVFGGLIFVGSSIVGFFVWCISDIRFPIGMAVIGIPLLLYSTRKYWHKETAYIPASPVATTAQKLSDVPGDDLLLNKNVEASD